MARRTFSACCFVSKEEREAKRLGLATRAAAVATLGRPCSCAFSERVVSRDCKFCWGWICGGPRDVKWLAMGYAMAYGFGRGAAFDIDTA